MPKYAFINKLLQNADFLFLQEHWLHNNDLSCLCNIGINLSFHGCSAMNDNVVLQGRPFGGVAILWHNKFNYMVTPCKQFSNRCCAIKLNLGGMSCVLACVYFPTDNFSPTASEDLTNTIDELETFIFSLNADCILLGGDFNTDFSRSNGQTNVVSDFCKRVNLTPHISFIEPNFQFTRSNGEIHSFIDHFAISSSFASLHACSNWSQVDDCVLHEVNLSDHCAISFTLTLPTDDATVTHDTSYSHACKPNVSWCKAQKEHIEHFKTYVSYAVDEIKREVPHSLFECTGCTSSEHSHAIDCLSLKLHNLLIDGSIACIPNCSQSTKHKTVIGWNNECAQLKRVSLFWHNVWVNCGRPNASVVADLMRSTRKRYHFAVRDLLRSQKDLRMSVLADACVNKPPNIFWREVKRANARPSSATIANVVNDHSDPRDIANDFKSLYSDTFRAGFTSLEDLHAFRKTLDNACIDGCWNTFTLDEVSAACNQLKPNKKDSDLLLNSSAFIHAPLNFVTVLCSLVNAAILHGHAPSSWLTGTILPLLKSSNLDKSLVTSYRPITLSSLFGKIVDMLVLSRYHGLFASSDRQFGFKKGCSTNHCTFVIKEVVSYYLNNNSDVFACALDMQKAFDRVDLMVLFKKLSMRAFPPVIIRFVFILYSCLSLCVFWNGAVSDNFVSLNGVKQGGILSPFLFNFFIDDLLVKLEYLHVGCNIGCLYFGCIAYADDILLLAPSLSALRIMLDCCSDFASCNNVLFNPTKSHCIRFSISTLPVTQFTMMLQGKQLGWTDSIVHLGHMLVSNNNDSADVAARKGDFSSQVNYFLAHFGHLPIAIKCKLFVTYCYSFYGCQLWDLHSPELAHFETVWRKAIRRVWKLPYRTHSMFLPYIMHGQSFRDVITSRFCKFADNCLHSENYHVRCIAYNASHTQLSCFGKNLMHISNNTEVRIASPHVGLVCELVFCRDGGFACGLSADEIDYMLRSICID